MAGHAPFTVVSVAEKVKKALVDFFKSLGRDIDEINDDTDLIRNTGANSDEGIDFAIDLSEVLGSDVPKEFNPFVHTSGKRGMKFQELVEHAERFTAAQKGGGHGG
jgi:hypothetical protein